MLKCYKHTTNPDLKNEGYILVPGAVKKLTGVAVSGDSSCCYERSKSNFEGFRIRLMINNRADNPLNIDYQDSFLNIYKNVNENIRLISLDYNLSPQTKIDYIITYKSQINKTIKLYLKFE